MNTQFNSNVIWLQLEYKISTLPHSFIFLRTLPCLCRHPIYDFFPLQNGHSHYRFLVLEFLVMLAFLRKFCQLANPSLKFLVCFFVNKADIFEECHTYNILSWSGLNRTLFNVCRDVVDIQNLSRCSYSSENVKKS